MSDTDTAVDDDRAPDATAAGARLDQSDDDDRTLRIAPCTETFVMNIRLSLRCLRYATVAALTTAAWWFHADLTAPGTCLDSGGAFDYARWLCDFDGSEIHAYIDTPITALPSFPVFCTSLIAFVAMRMRPARIRGRTRAD